MNKETFPQLIRRVLKEEVEKNSTNPNEKIYQRVPEVVHDKEYKEITPHPRDDRTKDELLDDITKIVKAIDSSFTVVWDDHDDISISGRDLFRIRVIPRWENNYNIEAMVRNEDRIFITGQNWEQVKQFVKDNLKSSKTAVDKAMGKVVKNREDQTSQPDKNLFQKDKPKILPLTNEPVKTNKNKEKNYTEFPKDNDDLPEKSMKEVKEFKKLESYKVKDPVKLKKKHDNDKHIVKMS
jgi:hypothetical protein